METQTQGSQAKTARNQMIMELRGEGYSFNGIAFELMKRGFERVSPQRIQRIVEREQQKDEASR